jgi:hypothetical protein
MMQNLSRNEKLLGLLLLLLAISGVIEGQPGLLVLLIILGVLHSMRSNLGSADEADVHAGERRSGRRRERPDAERIYQHALESVRRAGLNPDDVQVLPVDMGLLAFHGDDEPVIHRNWPVEDDCDYIQPFVQLRVPVAAAGRVRFEIFDNTGQPVFVNENDYQLRRGRNLIIPSTRLPVHDQQDMHGRWEVRITADNVLLARHSFEWESPDDVGFRRHVGEDGEISSELRALLAESRLQEMSLDDLLAHQEEDDARQRRSS